MSESPNRCILSVDLTALAHRSARAQLAASFAESRAFFRRYEHFWQHFPHHTHHLPAHVIVAADLSVIAKRFRHMRSPRDWVASVRKARPFFVAVVRTRDDERCVDLVDDLVRASDARISVCRSLTEADARAVLNEALTAFDPTAIATARTFPGRDALWVEFRDGLAAHVDWHALGLADLAHELDLQSASVGTGGRTVELNQINGDVFEIDATAIRALLDATVRADVHRKAGDALRHVGERIRAARVHAGLTQSALSLGSGIDQALISKMERGQHQPRYDTIERIAAGLGVSVTEMLAER